MDCSLPGSSVRGISQPRLLEQAAISSLLSATHPIKLEQGRWIGNRNRDQKTWVLSPSLATWGAGVGCGWVSVTFSVMWGKNDTTDLTGWCEDWQLGGVSQTLNQELSRPPFISLSTEGHILSPILYRAGNTAAEFGWLAQGSQLTAKVESTFNQLPCKPRGFCAPAEDMSSGVPNSTYQTTNRAFRITQDEWLLSLFKGQQCYLSDFLPPSRRVSFFP